ncbi:sensor histidine kinase [Haliea sp. E17]|uniref:sensor histidine kinase n=1 Tax=Haliea sp. E17 TaxID=3401576 RepID=UPI003AABD289
MLFFSAAPLHALSLEPGQASRQFHADIRYAVDDLPVSTAPDRVLARRDSRFAPLPSRQVDFGFTHGTVWLYLPVTNAGAQAGVWILSLNTRFMNELAVYQRHAAGWQLLLRNSERSTFAERPVDYRLLAVEFALAAGEQGGLLIGYQSRGTTYLPVTIESPASFAEVRARKATRSAGFYTAAALMLVYGLFQWLLLGSRIHLYYILYLGAALLYVFHMDGLSFQYLWPQLPGWNAFASLPLGLAINIAAANFARHFLRTWESAPRFDLLIRVLIGVFLTTLAWGLLVEDLWVKRAGFWLSSVGALVYLAAGINALRGGQRFARFYVAGWVGLCLATLVSSFVHSLPGVLPVALGFDFTKVGLLFDAVMFGMAIADQSADVRRQRDAALAREMAALAEQVRTRSALEAAEVGRADALRLAREKSLALASASHDIRQPLVSLKMALGQLSGEGSDARSALDSIAYLDALVGNYLDSEQDQEGEAGTPPQLSAISEPFAVQLIIDAVCRMFAPEAESRGIELRGRPSRLQVSGDPVATVRIVGNLVKNAIQHTASGGVLVGCRRQGGHCVLCVVDTGPGFPAAALKHLAQPYRRGDTGVEGHGLGLHIVVSLCEQLGYGFSLENGACGGAVARVLLRLASAADNGR